MKYKIDYCGNKPLQIWFLDFSGRAHRENGPAFEASNGYKGWWIHGRRHREDGPAIDYPDGAKRYFINGIELSEEKFYETITQTNRS